MNLRFTDPRSRTQTDCLHVTLSPRLDAAGVDGCLVRLRAFLQPLGLAATVQPDGLAVLGNADASGTVTPFNRGLVIGWLIAQPEFVLMTLQRRPAPAHFQVATFEERAHG